LIRQNIPNASHLRLHCLFPQDEIQDVPLPKRGVPSEDAFVIARSVQELITKPVCVLNANSDSCGKEMSLMLSLFVNRIERVVAELLDRNNGEFGVGKSHCLYGDERGELSITVDRRESKKPDGFEAIRLFVTLVCSAARAERRALPLAGEGFVHQEVGFFVGDFFD
jgi:hypothetical protein